MQLLATSIADEIGGADRPAERWQALRAPVLDETDTARERLEPRYLAQRRGGGMPEERHIDDGCVVGVGHELVEVERLLGAG